MITTVITSCNRPKLLNATLESYFKYVDGEYPVIVIDDSGVTECNKELEILYPQIQWIYNEKNIGQAASIDKAYALVNTPYIFHCEEDWEFYQSGFMAQSLAILEADKNVLQVWIRAEDDTNTHPIGGKIDFIGGVATKKVSLNYKNKWNGFSFNPGLRRKKDYELIGNYTKFSVGYKEGVLAEIKIGNHYRNLGFHSVIISGNGFVKHIGDGHHVSAKSMKQLENEKIPAFIIPYRNRESHLAKFLPSLQTYLSKQGIKVYHILIVEQSEGKPFNRAKVLNVGADYMMDKCDYFVMHDVDMIPITANYRYAKVAHIATQVKQFRYRMPYPDYFGGVTIFDKHVFKHINGYSNEFWGWGAEDDEILLRVKNKGYQVERRQCKFGSFEHDRDMSNLSQNQHRLTHAKQKKYLFDKDGLNSLEYKIADIEYIDNFTTKIKVKI